MVDLGSRGRLSSIGGCDLQIQNSALVCCFLAFEVSDCKPLGYRDLHPRKGDAVNVAPAFDWVQRRDICVKSCKRQRANSIVLD